MAGRRRFRGRRSEQIALRAGVGGVLFELDQILSGGAYHISRHTGKLRYLQAVALVGRPFLYAVQEHDVVLVLDGVEMNVDHLPEFFREPGQLEIMRGKQRETAVFFNQMMCDCPRQREPVES